MRASYCRIMDSALESFLAEVLTGVCHGSGFDGTWDITVQQNGRILCRIDYQCMNESGFYDGWIRLNYRVESDFSDYTLSFTADSWQRRKYLWETSYFEECFPLELLESASYDFANGERDAKKIVKAYYARIAA